MKNPTADPPTSTSPPFDASANALPASTLRGSVLLREELTVVDRRQMFALFATYFVAGSRQNFERDLDEKEWVALLREPADGSIAGFSTIARIELTIDGREVVAFFSGDTVVDARFWGESALSPLFARTVFAQADQLLAQDPAREVFWFLICSGYKTFRLLPAFFQEFYPHPTLPDRPRLRQVVEALAHARFGDRFDAGRGVVQLAEATPLQAGIAEITAERLSDPLIAFFAARNPGHRGGDELACLAPLTRANLTDAGRRVVEAGLGKHPEAIP